MHVQREFPISSAASDLSVCWAEFLQLKPLIADFFKETLMQSEAVVLKVCC